MYGIIFLSIVYESEIESEIESESESTSDITIISTCTSVISDTSIKPYMEDFYDETTLPPQWFDLSEYKKHIILDYEISEYMSERNRIIYGV